MKTLSLFCVGTIIAGICMIAKVLHQQKSFDLLSKEDEITVMKDMMFWVSAQPSKFAKLYGHENRYFALGMQHRFDDFIFDDIEVQEMFENKNANDENIEEWLDGWDYMNLNIKLFKD